MRIVDFDAVHVEQAMTIALQNYETERKFLPTLPEMESMPDLTPYAQNNLGVAAFEGDDMVGFLCSVSPFENAFGSTGATGVFSPMGASGAIGGDRAKTYAQLYQTAGEKWVKAGASSHAICLYAHDREANEQFYRYGFGMRCVDAIRDMSEVVARSCDGYEFAEVASHKLAEVRPLDNLLHRHMLESPCFMVKPDIIEEEFVIAVEGFRFFVAHKDGEIVAFLCAGNAGETFLCDLPGYIHANGAYCLPEHRGKGLLQNLLQMMVKSLKADEYTHLGVDFESINPPAYGFWLKYFSAYTNSVVRRIDEGAVTLKREKNAL